MKNNSSKNNHAEKAFAELKMRYHAARLAYADYQLENHQCYDYPPESTDFMLSLQRPPWVRYDYDPEQILHIERSIENASLARSVFANHIWPGRALL